VSEIWVISHYSLFNEDCFGGRITTCSLAMVDWDLGVRIAGFGPSDKTLPDRNPL